MLLKLIVKLTYVGAEFERKRRFDLFLQVIDHALVVACGLTQILAEGSGCTWGAVDIPDHDSWSKRRIPFQSRAKIS